MMLLLSLACATLCFTAQAADEPEEGIRQITERRATERDVSLWCCKVPCWGQSCEERWPDCALSRYNREQERRFRETFPEGGLWDEDGCSGEKCCVQYLRNTSSCNTTVAATTLALPVALGCAAYLVGGCGCIIGQMCCGACKNDCGIAGELVGKFICPGGCNPHKSCCCPPNVYNPLSWLADVTCLSTPFCAAYIDKKCIDCLTEQKTDEYQALQNVVAEE